MDAGEYRRDYAAYRSNVERALYEYAAGLSVRLDLRHVEERHADLWTRESVDALRRAREETNEQFETERAGLRALAGAASLKHLEAGAGEVTEELRRCEASAGVARDAGLAGAVEDADALASERDAGRRRELARRRLDASSACDDLRAARLDALKEAARGLGFEGAAALYESFTGVSLEALAADADAFLRRTESRYMSRLAEWAARELPSRAQSSQSSSAGAGASPDYADAPFFARSTRFDASFRARDFRAFYSEALAGLGVRLDSQRNLRVEESKRSDASAASACFAVRPPEDVRLLVGSQEGGLWFQRQSFLEGGRAQVFAWASRDSSARHPEFVYAPDAAAEVGHGMTLSRLFVEPAWLAAQRGARATEAAEAARTCALVELYESRRDCARLRHALALDAARDVRSEHLSEDYAARFTEATGFRHTSASSLLDADVWLASATRLRARLFAAGLREHLRSRHGRRWFASSAAGGELIDVWNTASRYRVEELALMLWGGELSFDLLADASLAALEGGEGA
jgi:hypothetical protein